MKFLFRLRDGKTHEFTLPDGAEVHRALMWVPKTGKKKGTTKFVIIPDDVESVEVID